MILETNRAAASTMAARYNKSIAQRLTLASSGLIAAAMLGLVVVTTNVTSNAALEQAHSGVITTTESLVSSINTIERSNLGLVERSIQGFAANLKTGITADTVQGLLYKDEVLLNEATELVDKFKQDTGSGVATIFVKKGRDFVRISTSLRDGNGQRVLGSSLDQAHPAYERLSHGQPFTGRANLFGSPYMTAYQPLRDASGAVVGIIFVGISLQDSVKALQDQVNTARLFENGGSTIIEPGRTLEDTVFIAHRDFQGQQVLKAKPELREALDNFLRVNGSTSNSNSNVAFFQQQGDEPWTTARRTGEGWLVVTEISNYEAMANQRKVTFTLWLIVGTTLAVISLGIWWMLRRGVAAPLKELTSAFTQLASGDLRRPFQSNRRDEVGALINEAEGMRTQYVSMLTQVNTSALSIASASAQIAQGNLDLSERTESTAQRLASTALSLDQVTQGMQQAADAARQAHQLSTSAVTVAERGSEVVQEVIGTMSNIDNSSRKISDIISVIDGIAFQTNILALNAAVEAARAGEQGRGFAVVAGEVRALAGRSAEAAKEIKTLIESSVATVETGTLRVQAAGQTMAEIMDSVQRVGDIVGEISASASEQSVRIVGVNGDISQLDQMTQQNAALVEESAAASQSMKQQATALEGTIAVFKC